MFFNYITLNRTAKIKGLAMLILVLHNFLHLTNSIGENEFKFESGRIFSMMSFILENPLGILNALLSYFGFYFMELFIFISSYGLTKQLLKKDYKSYFEYFVPHITKLYALMLVGFIIIIPFYHFTLYEYWRFFILTFSSVRNFSFNTLFIYVGPWWFFGLIIQFYLFFPLLFYYIGKKKEKGFLQLLILSYIFIYLIYPFANRLNFPLYGNLIGHLPEFLLGIILAMSKKIRSTQTIVLVSLLLFILSNFSVYFFPFSFLTATILLIITIYPIYMQPDDKPISKGLMFIGNISMFMFLINATVRNYTLPLFQSHSQLILLAGAIFHLILVILISYLLSIVFDKVIKPLIVAFTKWLLALQLTH